MVKDKIHNGQMKRLHQLLNQTKMMEHKKDLVKQFSKEGSESSKELLSDEADNLITHLEAYLGKMANPPAGAVKDDASDRMRKKIIRYARKMKWEVGGAADMKRIDAWCRHYGKFSKGLNQHSYKELIALVTQFGEVYSSYLEGINKI